MKRLLPILAVLAASTLVASALTSERMIPLPKTTYVTIRLIECVVSQGDRDAIEIDVRVDRTARDRWAMRAIKEHAMYDLEKREVNAEFSFRTNLELRVRAWKRNKWYRNDSDAKEVIGSFYLTSDVPVGVHVQEVRRGRAHYRVHFEVSR